LANAVLCSLFLFKFY